ncbi:UDP-2,3-diacylglucosamine diphosphatase [Arhodomonas sp. SL1]|uniref:UDP-2,3-diacylglucosamine diphosphatase n=1 Tax=Arhodomonas sp. SL1 TaxID=3425691 RepID=UPI003F882241
MSPTGHDSHAAPLLFISDLHLDPQRPAIIRLFAEFLATEATTAGALYILGDLFEAWIGDDAISGDEPPLRALYGLTRRGVPVRVMRGNRDFLLGERFAELTGVELLPDPSVIRIDGVPVALAHGDALCTDDHDYQRFRAMVRDPAWQDEFLARPLAEREAYARQAREQSSARNERLDDTLMDVNPQAVAALMREQGVSTLIHGHTHRPAIHRLELDGHPAERIVLGDWYDQGSVLRWHRGAHRLSSLPLGD